MQDQLEFQKKLQELMEIAEANGGRIPKEEVQAHLEALSLAEEQRELVYRYLEAKKITVDGHEGTGENPFLEADASAKEAEKARGGTKHLSDEEQAYLRKYRKAARAARVGQSLEELLARYERQELEREALISCCMELCAEEAVRYAGRGMLLEDLIQEGHIGLLMALDTLGLRDDDITGEDYIRTGIRGALEAMLEEEAVLKKSDEQILKQINHVADAIRTLSDDLGRKVSLEELSVYLEMEKEELIDILKLTGEEFSGEEAREQPEEPDKSVGYADIEDFKIF